MNLDNLISVALASVQNALKDNFNNYNDKDAIYECLNNNKSVVSAVKNIYNIFDACDDNDALSDIWKSITSRNSYLSNIAKSISSMQEDEREITGMAVGYIRSVIGEHFYHCRDILLRNAINHTLKKKDIDYALTARPFVSDVKHKTHYISDTIDLLHNIMYHNDFEHVNAPQMDSKYYNFTALNMPEWHSAINDHDTFYTSNGMLLRSHTSNAQAHFLENINPQDFYDGIKFYSLGKVYRRDDDQTHSPMFHQMEGFKSCKDITYETMINDIKNILSRIFNIENIPYRIRPSFFPFTEPSAEFDILVSRNSDGYIAIDPDGDTWIEILGCGLVHPNVMKMHGIDDFPAWAFGIGIERIAYLIYPDIVGINSLYK